MAHPTHEQIAYMKARDPEMILLFSNPYGYSAYDDDATTIETVAGIDDVSVDMAGRKIAFMNNSDIEACLSRIVTAGKRAAVCEQVTTTVECKAVSNV